MTSQRIEIKKIRVANWQGIDVSIPKNCWTAITGPSGSGKTSLLFSGLQAWSAQQFELLNNSAALPSSQSNSHIADDIINLSPVLASAGEIPRNRRRKLLSEVLNLQPLLDSWWLGKGQFKCSKCNARWRPYCADEVLNKVHEIIKTGQVVMVVSYLPNNFSADELLQQGLTKYWYDKKLCRIEDATDSIAADCWLLHDRFKVATSTGPRLAEALAVANSRGERQAIIVDDQLHELNIDNRCPECNCQHRTDDFSLRVIDSYSVEDLCCAPLSSWGKLVGTDNSRSDSKLIRMALKCGLSHLQVNRELATLSLGEARRIELLAWIAQARCGQTLIFDEPGIGLHGQERLAVAALFRSLVDNGNTVITADPSYEFLARADHCILVGPGSGSAGGRICASGSLDDLQIAPPSGFAKPVPFADNYVDFENLGARHLAIDNLRIPLQSVVAVCGISGSGKSTLFSEELWPRLKEMQKNHPHLHRGGVHSLLQRSLGVAARSTLATLSGCASELRELFAATNHAQQRGFKASAFVASPQAGACKQCKGLAVDKFGAECTFCNGMALRNELLELRFRGLSFAEWLDSPLQDLSSYLPLKGKLRSCIELMIELGLGSRRLAERGKVFSFGERGRIALARRLSLIKPGQGKLFLLDEACLGLPDNEAQTFLNVLERYCKHGHSFWLIEHHHVILRNAHHLIEIGPQAGQYGGKLVFAGTPAELSKTNSATANWLNHSQCRTTKSLGNSAIVPEFRLLADGLDRNGYKIIQSELAAELSMRSVLTHDQFTLTDITDCATQHPVAWPTPNPAKTSLLNCLGLDAYLQQQLIIVGKQCCSKCGGAGPYADLVELVRNLESSKSYRFCTELPSTIASHPQRKTWMAAAGYRVIVDDKYIELDSFCSDDVSADELSERCSDIEQQLAKLQQSSLVVFTCSDFVMQVDLSQCRDCAQTAELEFRLGKYSIEDFRNAKLADVLNVFQDAADTNVLNRALYLLKPSSLLLKTCNTSLSVLSSVEQRTARLIGLLLFGPRQLCLLFDNILAGFPVGLGRFLADECRNSSLTMHHADAAGYFESSEAQAIGSKLPAPKPFTSAFKFDDFVPSIIESDISFGEALQLSLPVADYFARSEVAKLRGYKPGHFILSSSPLACSFCRGKGQLRFHKALGVRCSSCKGSAFDLELATVVERGLSFTNAQLISLNNLRQYFSGSRIEKILKLAIDCGFGDFSLSSSLDSMPVAARALAPLLVSIGDNSDNIQISRIFDGLNGLQAEQVYSTIQGLIANRSLLEWRENHPRFNN